MAGEGVDDFLVSEELSGNVDLSSHDIEDRLVMVALKYEGAEGRLLMGPLQYLKVDGLALEIEVKLDTVSLFTEVKELECGLLNVAALEVSHADAPVLTRSEMLVVSYQVNGLSVTTADALLSLKLVPQNQEKLLRS